MELDSIQAQSASSQNTVNSLNNSDNNSKNQFQDYDTVDWLRDGLMARKRRLKEQKAFKEMERYASLHDLADYTTATTTASTSTLNASSIPLIQSLIHRIFTKRRKRKLIHHAIRIWHASQTWIVVTMIGLLVGFAAVSLQIVSTFFTDFKMGVCILDNQSSRGWYLPKRLCCLESDLRDCPSWFSWSELMLSLHVPPLDFIMYSVFALLFSVLSFWIVQFYSTYSVMSGLSELKSIVGGFRIRNFLSIRTGFTKWVSMALAVSSCLSIGIEEPLVHIAATIGESLPQIFAKYQSNPVLQREMINIACASGFAAAFGAPLSGLLFSLEDLTPFRSMRILIRSFWGCLVACGVVQYFDREGKLSFLQAAYDRTWIWWESFFFIILGVMGGVYGHYYVKCNLWIANLRQSHPFWTGKQVKWNDWLFWWPSFRQWSISWMYYGAQKLMSTVPIWLDTWYDRYCREGGGGSSNNGEDYFLLLGQQRREESASKKTFNWFHPGRSVVRRFLQELCIITAISVCLSYMNPFTRGDMVQFLSGLLRECNSDVIVFGKRPQLEVGAGLVQPVLQALQKVPAAAAVNEENDVFGLCYNSSDEAFSFSAIVTLLMFTMLTRAFLSCLSYGLRIPAGVYLSTMIVGACVGRIMGMSVRNTVEAGQGGWREYVDGDNTTLSAVTMIITPGTYALVGAASFLGGVSKLTVSVAVMMFEITGGAALAYIIPIMMSLMAAKFVSDALDRRRDQKVFGSLSDAYIRFHKYPYLDNKKDVRLFRSKMVGGGVMRSVPIQAREIMTPIDDITCIYQSGKDYRLQDLQRLLELHNHQGFPVLSDAVNRYVRGFIRRQDIVDTLRSFESDTDDGSSLDLELVCRFGSDHSPSDDDNVAAILNDHVFDLSSLVDRNPIKITPTYSMDVVVEMFRKMGLRYVLVAFHGGVLCEPANTASNEQQKPVVGSLVGILTKKDILRCIEQESLQGYDDHNGGGVGQSGRRRSANRSRQISRRNSGTTRNVQQGLANSDSEEEFIDMHGHKLGPSFSH
ncbi:hypothetical protein MP228_004315 [Amoeboaphelidium protococcarum]|nr:hypothetical protein MP228_004315 [Amoeboaphelidium protococcarum]